LAEAMGARYAALSPEAAGGGAGQRLAEVIAASL
jgi:hypothetical protein